MGFEVLLVLSALTPLLVLPWVWFTLPKGFTRPGWRSWAGFAGLVAITLQALVFIGAFFTIARIGGFDEKVEFWLGWMRINRIVCLVVIAVSMFGKGRFRWSTLSTAFSLIFFAEFVYELK